ncbi:MAG TPA: tetratricopeptide repeat protein [Candidatus Methanoperedens sp.]|nr:tetratricopeptide repeat protein [Candidatus Methanoperedens sp.]
MHSGRARSGVALVALAVALLAALPYLLGGLPGTFIALDDDEYILNTPAVLSGLTADGLRWALTTFHAVNWHPLTWLSHMLDVSLFALDARGHHLTSVLLHTLNAALLFLVLYRLTGARWRSALAAALFGVHPLRVESVAWIAERKDVLAGLFFMLVLLVYERAARRGQGAPSVPVLLLFALGLTAKPMLVTLPLVLLLLDWWPLGRAAAAGCGAASRFASWRSLAGEKLPLLALSLASATVTLLAQRAGGAVAAVGDVTAGGRIQNALLSIVAYLHKTFWPAGLAVYYPYPMAPPAPWLIAGAAAALLAVTVAAALLARRAPPLAVGWFWFLGMLVPVLGLVQVGNQAYADRYAYLPQIGVLVAALWGIAAIPAAARSRRTPAIAGALAVAGLAAVAAAQVGHWKDSETLFRHALAVTEGNWLIRNNLGFVLRAQDRQEEAAAEFRESIRIHPGYPHARNNLGELLAAAGRHEEAAAEYRAAIRLDPRYAQPRNNLGNSLAATGRLAEAIDAYREAIRLDRGYVHAHYNLGNVLALSGRLSEAEVEFREAVRLSPGFPEAWINLGQVLALGGHSDEALAALREVARLRPDDPEVRDRVADILASLGMAAEAAAQRGEARRLRERRR